MKLEYLSAVLIGFFLICISVPNLFAQNLSLDAQNTYLKEKHNLLIHEVKNEQSMETYLSQLRNKYYASSANIAKYGFDLVSVSNKFEDISNIRLRTGFSSLSKNATAGVQLIVSW